MTPLGLRALVQQVTGRIAGLALDGSLESRLNAEFPPGGEVFRALESACREGIAEGWLCKEGAGSRRFGRIFEPADDLARFSVDVVMLEDHVGNHHLHPTGEIDLVMPVTPSAKFHQRGAGFMVFGPGSGHRPNVTGGRAVILYLLPEGRIEWTKAAY